MVASKVKAAMGFQRSPATSKGEVRRRSSTTSSHKLPAAAASPHQTPPPHPSSNEKTTAAFARSFGVYFPRASAQVQPRPPDVAELVRLVEELQEKESRLRTQLLEQKILCENVAIVPFLEKDISVQANEIAVAAERIERLEAENRILRHQVEGLTSKLRSREETSQIREKRIADLVTELEMVKKKALERSNRDSQAFCVGDGVEIDYCSSLQRFQGLIDFSARSNLLRNLRKSPKSDIGPFQDAQKPRSRDDEADKEETIEAHHQQPRDCEKEHVSKPRLPRIPNPPPTRPISCNSSTSSSSSCSSSGTTSGVAMSTAPKLTALPHIPKAPPAVDPTSTVCGRPPPPPPPPPPSSRGLRSAAASVRRIPEVVELYHSLMRRESKRDTSGGAPEATPITAAANTRDMIGEIENRSAHLLAIKTDVETQGDFIRFLIKQVEHAVFTNIEDVVAFVKWLDDELSCLVDERAVLKHFEWPENKADAMREAAFGYCDLNKLESEASSFHDDPRQPCASALKKMQAVLDKLEQGVYNLSRVRDNAAKRYKGFGIPWEWMQEGGYISQIKLASVKLAMKCMKRVSSELEIIAGGPDEEELMLLGVRFAFRVHQFAGGFDVDTMRAFQELKDKARYLQLQSQNHNQHKLFCKPSTC